MNKSAEEMFKELGFAKNTSICYRKNHILYEKCIKGDGINIGFDIFTVEFKENIYIYTDMNRYPLKTSMKIHKAINKQLEELGWI